MTTSRFKITPTPPTSIKLDPGQEGKLSFTVENLAAPDKVHEIILQALLIGEGGKGKEVDWLVAGPQQTLSMSGGETKTVIITARPKPTSPRGENKIKLVVADKDRPNDMYADSPTVACEVSGPTGATPTRKRPWWLIPAIVGGLLLVAGAGLAVWKAMSKPGAVVHPPVDASRDAPVDAGIDAPVDASIDAPTARCDVTKPFGPPVPVDGVNTSSDDRFGWLSADQLTIYFSSTAGSPDSDLYSGTRAQPTGAFSGAAPLGGVNSTSSETRPVLTADGLTLFMDVSDGVDFNIHVATRASVVATFSAHTSVAVINSTSFDLNPWISDDGLVMYFASKRAGTFDIFKTTRASTSSQFSAPVAVGELNGMTDEGCPVLSKDGLEIFFGSTRTNSANDIFHATRSTLSDGFGMPTLVAEVSNSASEDFPTWVSPDRCQLVFTSNRGGGSGGYDIWIATRPQ